jgi:hypothetical protein
MISDAFASGLRSGRAEFNAQFAEARRRYPELDAEAFAGFLQTAADPVVRAVASALPERGVEAVRAIYDAALELVGQRIVGPCARRPFVEEGWKRVLPAAASLLATSPAGVVAAVSNALHRLGTTAGARPAQWIEEMERLAPRCREVDSLLKLGQVAAWRAGLAHFRQGAIAAADTVPETLALAAVGAPASARWADVRQRLLANPWFDPSNPEDQLIAAPVRVAAQVGAFRGFGGLFTKPPRVTAAGEHFLVCSGEEGWLLTADAFGATFHRATVDESATAQRSSGLPSGLEIAGSKIAWQGNRFEIPALGELTSAAANAATLAVTSSLTHSVVLVALARA